MEHAAVLGRGPASVLRAVRGDQLEHSLPLETERAPSTDVRQDKSAVTSRHDAAQRAHHAGHRRAVPECGDHQELAARLTRLLHGMRFKKPAKCLKTVLSSSTPTRTGSSSSCAGSWRLTQSALTASSTLTRCRAASCWCIRSAGAAAAPCRLNCRATPKKHDIHDRFLHGPCPAGHAGAHRARRQDRRRLARAALAGAHSSRHVRERLGDDGHDPAARGHSGQRAAPEQGRTGVDPSLGHGQHPPQ